MQLGLRHVALTLSAAASLMAALPAQSASAARLGTGCATSAGTCRLNVTGPRPVGTSCWCRNKSTGKKFYGSVVR